MLHKKIIFKQIFRLFYVFVIFVKNSISKFSQNCKVKFILHYCLSPLFDVFKHLTKIAYHDQRLLHIYAYIYILFRIIYKYLTNPQYLILFYYYSFLGNFNLLFFEFLSKINTEFSFQRMRPIVSVLQPSHHYHKSSTSHAPPTSFVTTANFVAEVNEPL